eukprot:COSAG02_NODE_1110_length_14511_cov_30.804122_1_plen_2917_part_00
MTDDKAGAQDQSVVPEGSEESAGSGLMAKANAAMDTMTDHLPPSLRTKKFIASRLGANNAGRSACLKIIAGERLTRHQKRAIFRLGRDMQVDDGAMMSMLKLHDGVGVTPAEIAGMEAAALAKGVLKQYLSSFGWRAAENAGPGAVSVIVEAQALIRHEASAVDTDDEALGTVQVLRALIHERPVLPRELAGFICSLIGLDSEASQFVLRFCKDVLSNPEGDLATVVRKQILVGRGCAAWSTTGLSPEDQIALIDDLIDEIESGAPLRPQATPGKDQLLAGAAFMKKAMADANIDEVEARQIFESFDKDSTGTLTSHEVDAVVLALVRESRDAMLKTEVDPESQQQIKAGFKTVLQYYQSDEGRAAVKAKFDVNGDDEISEHEFLENLKPFLDELTNQGKDDAQAGSTETPVADLATMDASTKSKKKSRQDKKAEKAAEKLRAQEDATMKDDAAKRSRQVKKANRADIAGEFLDSEDEGEDDGGEMGDGPASPRSPKGGLLCPRGFREFMHYMKEPGGEAPRGLASVLYMAVKKTLPVSVARSLQNLVLDVAMDATDCANLLAFQSRGVYTEDAKQLSHAVEEYTKLTNVAWELEAASQLEWSSGRPDESDTEVDSASTLAPADAPTGDSDSGSPKDTLIRMAQGYSDISKTDAAALHVLAKEVLDGSALTGRKGPPTLSNSGLESLFDGHWPTEMPESKPATQGPAATTTAANDAVRFANPLAAMDDDLELAERVQGGNDEDADADDSTPDTSTAGQNASATDAEAMQKYAAEFEPDYIVSTDISLVRMLRYQSQNRSTLPAFQSLLARRPLSEAQLSAVHVLAEAKDTDPNHINVLMWLWTGGNAAKHDMLKRMVEPVTESTPTASAVSDDAKGSLMFTVVKASRLLKVDTMGKSDPFCSVRVEGHQRVTQVIQDNLNPEWELNNADAATFNFRVVNRTRAIVEVYIFDEDRGGKTKPMGCVTFPLSILSTGGAAQEFEFDVEPTRGMPQERGLPGAPLGTITLRMEFVPSATQVVEEELATSDAVERLIAAADTANLNAELQALLRKAASIVIARTKSDLKAPAKKNSVKQLKEMEKLGKLDPQEPSLDQLQEESKVKKKETKRVLGRNVALVDLAYVEDVDVEMEAALRRPMRAKYMVAIAYCLSKFLGINPAVLNVIENTINKFEPAPEVTGGFAAAFLGTLELDTSPQRRKLALIKRYLTDRLSEEMEKLLLAAGKNKQWRKALRQITRNKGASAASVDHASEIVGEADSFSTAAALYRLRHGSGPAEPDEIKALDDIIQAQDGENKDFITAGVQNLQKMIWPTREETFNMVRELLSSSSAAEAALAGWENRAELKLVLKSDVRAIKCLNGLVAMEELREHLVLKEKELELIGLDKLLADDKAAIAVMRRLTPSWQENIQTRWTNSSKFEQFRAIFFACCGAVMALSSLVKSFVADTAVGVAILAVVDLMVVIAAGFIGIIIAVHFIMNGQPYRDKVVGPDPVGVERLQTIAANEPDETTRDKALAALDKLLLGAEANTDGVQFLHQQAAKYQDKVPEMKEALDTMEYIFTLQSAGKDTSKLEEYNVEISWPGKNELWPPSKLKLQDAKDVVIEKTKRFFFKASVHPWMKKYAEYAGDTTELYQTVEIPLSMMKDNSEEFDALDKLAKGYRPDPKGMQSLQDTVNKINDLDNNGPDATNLQQALQNNTRTGDITAVFEQLDQDGSGTLDHEEFDQAGEMLAKDLGFHLSVSEMDAAWAAMDASGDGVVDHQEFSAWWKSLCVSKKERKLMQQQQMTDAGMLADSPRPKELAVLMKIMTNFLPTIGLQPRTLEALEDMCQDDETFDCLQECFNLCELKRLMINDKEARNAIAGLEAMCMVPLMLQGNEELNIPPNPEAMAVLQEVKTGNKAATAALAYLRQPERRRYWGMMTQRQRRLFMSVCTAGSLPLMVATGILDTGDLDVGGLVVSSMTPVEGSTSGSWDDIDDILVGDSSWDNSTVTTQVPVYTEGSYTNPSFYILGLIPMVTSLFVNFFGQRIASLITLTTVFISAAGTGINAALAAPGGFTPAKFMGCFAGVFAGGTALKVASGNIKFAYGVQGATIGAVVSQFSSSIWRPRLLWLIPEMDTPALMGWVDLTVGGAFGAGAAYLSNQYRNIISIFATAGLGTLGTVQTMVSYGIPGMDGFTMSSLSASGMPIPTDFGGFLALGVVGASLWGGTMNQFKMDSMDFSLPAITTYERFLTKIEKGMSLIFALNEFINKAEGLDTNELMEQVLAARDKMSGYIALGANLMQFSLCFGFVADFVVNFQAGVFDAVPWVGVTSLVMAIVTPAMAAVGTIAGICTQPQLLDRMLEVKVPPFAQKFFPNVFPIGRESFIIKFGPVGKYLQQLSFYMSTVNGFISMVIVGVSWLTAEMYRIDVLANWDELQLSMPEGMTVEQAMDRVSGSVSGLGDSAMGLVSILIASITSTAYDLGGSSWLIVHLVEMENFFILGSGLLVSSVGLTMGMQYPAGNYMFGPLGVIGLGTSVFGVLQSVPFFEQKFPDIMYTLHQAQLILAGGLGFMFVGVLTVARSTDAFVANNWNGCHYDFVCEYSPGDYALNYSLSEYATAHNINQEQMVGKLKPMLYASAMSCLTSLMMLLGGSNLAKYAYYMTIMSRREELAATAAGGSTTQSRHAALTKKVRGQRQADITAATRAMRASAIKELEEAALIMEFATGVSMEQHFDLAAHDEIMAEIDKAAAIESNAAAVTKAAIPGKSSLPSVPDIGLPTDIHGGGIDDLNLVDAQAALGEGGMTPEQMQARGKKQLDKMTGGVDEFDMSSHHDQMKHAAKMGVQDTGSSLATLARALGDDGVRTEFHDNREDEKIPLKSRIKGAKQLMERVKNDNLAGWDGLDIQAKRTLLYEAMQAEVEGGSMMPSVSLNSLFERRL